MGACPDCQGEGWLDDETRCPCLRDEATVTVAERPMMPCPWDGLWTHICPKCGVSDGAHNAGPIEVGRRVEVGYTCGESHADIWPDVCAEWNPVATATVAEVVWSGVRPPNYGDYVVTLTDIEDVS
jgi:hypothetical protein